MPSITYRYVHGASYTYSFDRHRALAEKNHKKNINWGATWRIRFKTRDQLREVQHFTVYRTHGLVVAAAAVFPVCRQLRRVELVDGYAKSA